MIDSILSRKRRVITLDRILFRDPLTDETTLITDSEQIKSHTNQHFQTVAGGRHQPKQLNSCWARQYTPLSGIKDEWYSTLMSPPTRDEWQLVINSLPNGKAAGPSGVSNEMLKHLGKSMANALWKLICNCCQLNDIPADWREAVVYPIPKPTNWECDLNKTRPITLLETPRKALVKIINQRLSHTIANHGILEGGNHAGLPGGSTLPPTRILNALIEDATENKKELWVLFQDLSKAYDRVNGYMLDLAMQRIKLPLAARDFILNLFSCRKNRVITSHGLTDPYDVLIGIDQGEVISPLLWTIYYDPLLCEIQQQRNIGYELTHTWSPNLTHPELTNTLSEMITSQAYMDDTNWIGSSKQQIEKILTIAHDFYNLNNILVNDHKAVLMTTAVQVITDSNTRDKRAIPITFLVGSKSITLTPLLKTQSTRFLGVWVSLSKANNFIFNQVKSIVQQNCNIMKRKFLTDLQLQYIFNRVLAPQIEYQTQLTIFNEFQCAQLFAPLRKLFKHKIGLASTAPNYITDCHSIYNVSNLSDLQLLSHVSKLHKQLNNDNLLGDVTRIRLRNLQTFEWMVSNPLVS